MRIIINVVYTLNAHTVIINSVIYERPSNAQLLFFLCVVPTAIPIVGYDASLLDDYEQKYIMPFIGGDGAGALMHIPLQWGNPKKNGCLSVHISPTAITVRSYWNNAWSESKFVPLT